MAKKVSQKISSNTNNLEELFKLATAHEIQAGIGWYKGAYDDCADMAQRCNIYLGELYNEEREDVYYIAPYDAVVVVSLLSPRMAWTKNVSCAETLIKAWMRGETTVSIPTFTANRNKAFRYLTKCVDPFTHGAGESKVPSFAYCINYWQTNRNVVCIDGHAIGAWLGSRTASASAVGKAYQTIQSDYINLAKKYSLLPHEMQATIWLVYRRIHKINN